MDFKHFSHPHPLTYHQLPQPTAEALICSGCNFHIQDGPDTFYYTCWQCQFFLHDQCFRAARSLSHPAHSAHHLCLIPNPTYPSGTFVCNQCNLQGIGFSYSCPSCDFDLHIHCACNTNNNFVIGIQNSPLPYLDIASPCNIYPPSHTQNFCDTNMPYHNNFPPNPTHYTSTQYPFMPEKLTNNDFPDLSNTMTNESPYPPNYAQNFLGNHFPNHDNYPPSQASYQDTHYPFMPENTPHQMFSANMDGAMPLPQPKGVKHFSHEHNLDLFDVKEKNIVCNGCEKEVSGMAYRCVNSDCKFFLHRECFGLPRELQHKFHNDHTLDLVTVPPTKGSTCNACLKTNNSFTYNCSTCQFSLHVSCAFLPETKKRDDHPHSLSLIPSLPDYKEEDEEHVPTCDVCQDVVDVTKTWFYLCQECDFGTHLGCVDLKATPLEKTKEELLASALIELQVLELKQRLSKLNADFANEGA